MRAAPPPPFDRTVLLCDARKVAGVLLLASVPWAGAVADEFSIASAIVQPLTRAQAEVQRREGEAPAAEAYQDRYMQADDLAELGTSDEEAAASEPEGLRAWLLETRVGGVRASATGLASQHLNEWGLRAEYRQQTLNHGEWLWQSDGRKSWGDTGAGLSGFGWWGAARHASGGRVSISNLAFPLGSGWLADTRLGDGYSDVTSGLTRQQRLSLGIATVRGLRTRIYDGATEVRAGWGQRGGLAGSPYPGFENSAGQLGWLGATHALDGRWFVAGQMGLARDVPVRDWGWAVPAGAARHDVTSWALALGQGLDQGWSPRDDSLRWRLSLLGSHARGATGTSSAQGLHVEGEQRVGRYVHSAGVHLARPRLYFADQRLFGGDRGAFWRVDYSDTRLAWGAGLDLERARADADLWLPGYRRASASANLQYARRRDNLLGGSLTVAQTRYEDSAALLAAGGSRSLYAQAFYQDRFFDWPRTRLSLTLRHNQAIVLDAASATGQELQWEQDWIGGRYETQRPELTTTLGYAWDRSGGMRRRYPTAGVQFRHWFDNRGFVAGNLRYTSVRGGLATSRGLSGSVNAEYELTRGWRLGLLVSLNQARSAFDAPPGWSGPTQFRSRERSAYLFLRWEGQAGRPYAVAGRASGPGSGSIVGHVYFDANGDGRRQLDEAGAPQVEVVLDGRYRTRTDADGRFEFPLVATGSQRLALTLDTVPRPWGLRADGGINVTVPLRGAAMVELPVVRVAP